MNSCAVAGCNEPTAGLGYCNKHYIRFKKHGDPLKFIIPKSPNGEPLKFLLESLSTDTDDCIHWPYAKVPSGVGRLLYNGKLSIASRVVCELAHGKPPTPKHEAAHLCGKGHEGCINHKHLRWKTKLENEADKIAHGTLLAGEKHNCVKLTVEQVREIRTLSHLPASKVAPRYDVSIQAIYDIRHGRTWRSAYP